MKARDTAAARRYARALLEVALAQGAGDEVRRGLQDAAGLIAGHPDLRLGLLHPALGAEKKRALVERIWKDEHALVRRLVLLLAERQRVELVPEIERHYSRLWNSQRGVVPAEALTVEPLSEAQRGKLAQALGRLTGREVELSTRLAPEILGGLVVRMDGKVYDGSVRGRLRALKERLVGEAQGA